jgi:hypothetical protein
VPPSPTTSEFAQVANMQGVALMEGPMPIMTAAEVARQGYAALKAGRPEIITGLVNRMIAMSTRFTRSFGLAEREPKRGKYCHRAKSLLPATATANNQTRPSALRGR